MMNDKKTQDLFDTFPDLWQPLLQKEALTTPTDIQTQVYRAFLQSDHQDLMITAPTGSGKTLAYLWQVLPTIQTQSGLQVVIFAPSQELVMQITEVAKQWAAPLGIKVQSIIGNANKKRQVERLKKKPEVIVATLGRFIELTRERKIKLHQTQYVIFDEADQFFTVKRHHKIVEQGLKLFPKHVTYWFVSATLNAFNDQLVRYLPDIKPERVTSEHQMNDYVSHYYLVVDARKKIQILEKLANVSNMHALVFIAQKNSLQRVHEQLIHKQVLHGILDSEQSKQTRQQNLKAFKQHQLPLLLTTDIASRGLDIPELSYVIQYEPTYQETTFLHRIGRVGRMNTQGSTITLLSEHEVNEYIAWTKQQNISLKEIYLYRGSLTETRL